MYEKLYNHERVWYFLDMDYNKQDTGQFLDHMTLWFIIEQVDITSYHHPLQNPHSIPQPDFS